MTRATPTVSRPWKMPDLRAGTTINFLADTQQGYRANITDNWVMRIADDAQEMKAQHAGHVHGGDCIEWNVTAPEDAKYQAFVAAITKDGKPYLDVPGNHDLCTYASTSNRTADQWAQAVRGRPQANTVQRMGDVAVIGLSGDTWLYDTAGGNYAPPTPLSDATLIWLSNQLDVLGSTPTWIVTHALPMGQAGVTTIADAEFIQPWPQLMEIFAGHGNVIGWLSGHWHIAPDNAIGATVLNVGGRRLYGINAPAASGIRGGWTAEQMQWQSNSRSMFITYAGDHVDIRWRCHSDRGWLLGKGAAQNYQMTLT